MTTGFDANVPARKPRTISRVLSELTAVSDNGSSPPDPLSVPERGNEKPATIELTAEPAPAAPKPGPRVAHGKNGKERTASLRERLAMTAHRSAAGAEPQQTAAAVRER